jgi:branched-chain amino acid transport system ATP-binding protein
MNRRVTIMPDQATALPVDGKVLLDVKGVGRRFGGLVALANLDVAIRPGEALGLIGPNGAGKTTFFNIIAGAIPVSSGSIHLDGERISGLSPDRIAGKGIARTFQNIRLFDEMSVLENVLIGRHRFFRASLFGLIFRTKKAHAEENLSKEVARKVLERVGLADKMARPARSLSYGDQRRLEIARALALEPKLLLLDEPMAGMNPTEKADLSRLIVELNRSDMTILLIEHDMKAVMGISKRVIVLHHGEIIADGAPDQVRADRTVIDAYLGRRG